MIQRDAIRRVLRFFQQRVHGPYPIVVGRRGGGQVVIVPQQAVADEIAAEADICLGVVEIVEGQILCRGNFRFYPVERDLSNLHQAACPGVGIHIRVEVAFGADEGVQNHRIYAVFPGIILNVLLIALGVFPAVYLLPKGGKQDRACQGQHQQHRQQRQKHRPFAFLTFSHVPPFPAFAVKAAAFRAAALACHR